MTRNNIVSAYLLLVGLPILGLLGILDVGRGMAAPPGIAGEWNVELDPAGPCSGGLAGWRQPAFNISQSGTAIRISLNDGRATVIDAALNASRLTAQNIDATISGKSEMRSLAGRMEIQGCGMVAFRAVRPPARKSAE